LGYSLNEHIKGYAEFYETRLMLDRKKLAQSLRATATVHVEAMGKQVKRQKWELAKEVNHEHVMWRLVKGDRTGTAW
jgi:hypothetical protein